ALGYVLDRFEAVREDRLFLHLHPVCTSAFPRSTRTAVARGSGPLAGASVDPGVRLLQAGQQRVQVLAAPVAQLLAEFSRRVLRCMGRVGVELLVQGALEAPELLDASQLLFGHPGQERKRV